MFYEQVYERLRLFFERLLIIFPYLRFSIYDGLFAPLYENEPFEFFFPDGLFLAVVELVFSASALVIIFLFAE